MSGEESKPDGSTDGHRLDVAEATGQLTLPNGHVIPPSYTVNAFRSAHLPEVGQQRNPTIGRLVATIDGGPIGRGMNLHVQLTFRDQVLANAELSVEAAGQPPAGWPDLTVEVLASRKGHLDDLLAATLGRPHRLDHHPARSFPGQDSALGEKLEWRYPWGSIESAYDSKTGDTNATIRYR